MMGRFSQASTSSAVLAAPVQGAVMVASVVLGIPPAAGAAVTGVVFFVTLGFHVIGVNGFRSLAENSRAMPRGRFGTRKVSDVLNAGAALAPVVKRFLAYCASLLALGVVTQLIALLVAAIDLAKE